MTSTLAVPVQLPPERPPGYEPLGWKTVPLKNRNFIGRDGMLHDMHVMLVNSGQTAVLLPRAFYGLGGVGKTQLAIEYTHRRKNEFDLVWWVAAEDPAEIRRSLVQLAELIGVPQAGDTNSTIHRVLAALNRPEEHYRNWLVVFDNVGDPSTVEGLLPSPQKGRVLITTRESQWEEYGQAVRVDKFARSESVELLGQQGGLQSADADAVAEQLDDLPISLAQAAAWHRATGASFRQYLDVLRDEVARRRGNTDTMGYPAHAAAAMSLAFQQLQKTSEQAALLLQLAAYFGPEWISLDLLHRGRLATDLSKALGGILRDQAPLQRAVKEIARWELARNDTRNLRFQVHRLVQHLLQTEMAPDLRESVRHTVQTMIAYANPGNPDRIDPAEMRKHAELSAHIVASGLIDSCDDEARQVVLDQIRYRYVVGDYESSLALATEAIDKWTTPDNADDPFLLIARRHRAGAIAALGNPEEALGIGRQVWEGFERTFGRNHEHTMVTVTGVGRDLRALGHFDEAYALDEENHRLQTDELGPDDRLTLQTAGNLAVDLRMLGRYEDALDRDLQTMSATLNAFGPRDVAYLLAVSNVARDFYALGRYQEALDLQLEALPTHEAVRGRNHPHVLLARRTVVMCLRKLGRTQEAVNEGRPLMVAFRNRLGERHPDTLLVMQSLMNAVRDNSVQASDLDEAVEIGEQAMEGYELAFPDHPFKQICLANLAIVYRHRGRSKARAANESALRRLREIFGEDNPYTLCAATNLANGLAGAGELQRAREMSADILEKSRRRRGPSQPYTLICALNHSIDLLETGDPRGEAAWQEAVTAMRRALGDGHPEVKFAQDRKRIDCDIEAPPT